MDYRIYPSIGIARIGNSSSFFVGPEVVGSAGRELGTGEEVQSFKDGNFRTRRQAARFRIYQYASDGSGGAPATFPAGTRVVWTVRVANIKDAIRRPSAPPATVPIRPVLDPSRSDRVIDSGDVSISGLNSPAVSLSGRHVGSEVDLGFLVTDADGQLLVVGGPGVSRSSPLSPIGDSFYNNVNWRDDVCDGVVSATIVFPDGRSQLAESSTVVVAPPDFARGSHATVSLYDIVHQLAVDQGWIANPAMTSFTGDVYPLLMKTRSLQYSHSNSNWLSISSDYARLSSTAPSESSFRMENRNRILRIEGLLWAYRLTAVQKSHLERWVAGLFSSDWTGYPPVAETPTPQSLNHSGLDATAGQGFFPGIECGRVLTDPSIYRLPFDFRINTSVMPPGYLTALMAQPWQADFLKCAGSWWPSQRPDRAPQLTGPPLSWARNSSGGSVDHKYLVDHVMKFGVITPQSATPGANAYESGRDPSCP